MAGYSRSFNRSNGEVIEAPDFVNEYEALDTAFDKDLGHKHDGTLNNGAYIPVLSDQTNVNEVLVDGGADKIVFSVSDTGVKTAQVEIVDGAILPSTDADIDLGSMSKQLKNIYAAGTANVSVLSLSSGISVSAVYDQDDMLANSNVALATQQSIKAYVDNSVTSGHTHDGTNGTIVNFIASDDELNVLEVDDANNRFLVSTDVTGTKTTKVIMSSSELSPFSDLDIALGGPGNRFTSAWAQSLQATTLQLGLGGTADSILDEDAFTSNSDTALATQQSIKAYVDSEIASGLSSHTHDGTTSPTLSRIQSPDGYNVITINDTANRIVFQIDVGSTATSKAAIDSVSLYPASDLDIDLGKVARRFTNVYAQNIYAEGGTVVRQTVPSTAVGDPGDQAGMIAADSTYIYVCYMDYDGVSNIWSRVAVASW